MRTITVDDLDVRGFIRDVVTRPPMYIIPLYLAYTTFGRTGPFGDPFVKEVILALGVVLFVMLLQMMVIALYKSSEKISIGDADE